MAVTLDTNISLPCSGGGHFEVTMELVGLGTTKTEVLRGQTLNFFTDPLEDAEIAGFMKVAARILYAQATGTNAQKRTQINNKILDLTL